MPLTNGSGSCYFRHRPSRCQPKPNFLFYFFCLLLFVWRYIYIFFSKIKSQKQSQNSRNQGFSYYFCMMIEGAGSGSGSIPLTNRSGSGSRRPKNMWIRWIRIPIRNLVLSIFKLLHWKGPSADWLFLKDVLTSCPVVSDVDGLVYWSQTDESGGVRVYQEDSHNGHWTIQAQNREDLGKLSFSGAVPGSGVFLTPGARIRNRIFPDPWSRIPNT